MICVMYLLLSGCMSCDVPRFDCKCLSLFVCRLTICYPYAACSFLSDLLYFTQVNKAPVRLLGMCLWKDVVVLAGSTLAGPTIF